MCTVPITSLQEEHMHRTKKSYTSELKITEKLNWGMILEL